MHLSHLSAIALMVAAPAALAQPFSCSWSLDQTRTLTLWITPQQSDLVTLAGKVTNSAPSQAFCTGGVCYPTTRDDLIDGILSATPRYDSNAGTPYYYGHVRYNGRPATLIVNLNQETDGTITFTDTTQSEVVTLGTFQGCS